MPANVADLPLTENEELRRERMELGACHFPGCMCTGYVVNLDDPGVCQRPECRHRDTEHSVE